PTAPANGGRVEKEDGRTVTPYAKLLSDLKSRPTATSNVRPPQQRPAGGSDQAMGRGKLNDGRPKTTQNQSEPNNTSGTANTANTSNNGLTEINGSISSGSDVDFFKVTLSARTGLFLDIDSRETGLSTTLNSIVTLFQADGTTQVGTNDNGYDFDTA